MSSRYTPLPDESYTPSVARVLANQVTANRQAAGTGAAITEASARSFVLDLEDFYANAQQLYERALHVGVPKELARLCLPVARYSAMRASANLLNWLKFLKLRCDQAAQQEIREYANVVAALVRQRFPRTYEVARQSAGLP